jgi:hypothetical protein
MSSQCTTTCNFRFRNRAFVFALLALPIISATAANIELRGREAEAIGLVTKIFKSKQGTKYAGWPVYGDLRYYSAQLERHQKRIEIIFVPDQPPLKPNEAGTGGGTKYGWEVHYIVALDRMKILEEHYAR